MNAFEQALGINYSLYTGFIAWSLVFTRTFVMMMLTPFIGGKGVPGRVRMVVGIVLSTYIFFALEDSLTTQLPEDKGMLIGLFFKEIFFGLCIGMTTIMCFYAIDAGGRIIDNQRGSANAQIFIPQLGQVSLFGLFEFWLAMSLFISISGHITFLNAFVDSFVRVPVMTFPVIEPGITPFLELIIRMSAEVLVLGMQLAAPVLIAIFLTDLVLGIANKMAPQIPVFEMGFLLKGVVGVIMVWLSVVFIATQMGRFFDLMQSNVMRVIRYFGG